MGWLREFQADGAGLVAGNALHGTVVPPVPCRLRLDIRLRRCDRPRSVQAAVGSDLSGRAVLRLEDADGGTRAAVAWSLEMCSLPRRVAARVAYPLMRWGHDQVVDMAVAGFRRRAMPTAAISPQSDRRQGLRPALTRHRPTDTLPGHVQTAGLSRPDQRFRAERRLPCPEPGCPP